MDQFGARLNCVGCNNADSISAGYITFGCSLTFLYWGDVLISDTSMNIVRQPSTWKSKH